MRCMPGSRDGGPLGRDLPAVGPHAGNAAADLGKSADLAVLDDIDSEPVGGTGVTPGNRIVPRGTGPTLQQSGIDRETSLRRVVEVWHFAHQLVAIQQLGID